MQKYKCGECGICGASAYSTKATYCEDCITGSKPSSVEYAVRKAIANGELKPAKECICVDCGNKAAHYDHRDYNKPLDVQPVCRSCNRSRGHAVPFGRSPDGKRL